MTRGFLSVRTVPGFEHCRNVAALALVLLSGCLTMHQSPPPPEPVPAVALLTIADPPDRSAVSGVFTFYSWIAPTRAAVPSMLAGALRAELSRHGIAVQDAGAAGAPQTLAEALEITQYAQLDAPALFVRIGKWEANQAQFPDRVDVALEAVLLSPSGEVLWRAHRDAGPVATLGSASLVAAYQRAADQVAADLVGRWEASCGGAEVRTCGGDVRSTGGQLTQSAHLRTSAPAHLRTPLWVD